MCKTISPFFYYSELKRYERKKSFIGHQYFLLQYQFLFISKYVDFDFDLLCNLS